MTVCAQESNEVFSDTTITLSQRQALCDILEPLDIAETSDLFMGISMGIRRLYGAIYNGNTEESFFYENDSHRHTNIDIGHGSTNEHMITVLKPFGQYCHDNFNPEQISALKNIIKRLYFPTDFHLPKMKSHYRKGVYLVGVAAWNTLHRL
jgi:hypothetical protein